MPKYAQNMHNQKTIYREEQSLEVVQTLKKGLTAGPGGRAKGDILFPYFIASRAAR